MNEKVYITAQDLFEDSLRLGVQIIESDFRPQFIVGVWRGGSPVGIVVQELLHYFGIQTDHISIRTSSYKGIEQRGNEVRVHGLSYLIKNMNAEDSLLIVDDVFDTGLSIQAIFDTLQMKARKNTADDIRTATTYFKPANNKTMREPDFFVHETDKWLVFPHELEGLSLDEIFAHKPGTGEILSKIALSHKA